MSEFEEDDLFYVNDKIKFYTKDTKIGRYHTVYLKIESVDGDLYTVRAYDANGEAIEEPVELDEDEVKRYGGEVSDKSEEELLERYKQESSY